jgi:signal transduction histidine kinase
MKLQTVRLDELLADCVKRMKPIADSKRVMLALTVHDVAEIQADEDKLRSAILNLLDNAIKYSKNGGTVDIISRSNGRDVEVTVGDHGEGIAPEEVEHVFERFHRAASSRSQHDGSGLGLAIVRRILEVHKGSVSVRSKIGEGSTFTIALPGPINQ